MFAYPLPVTGPNKSFIDDDFRVDVKKYDKIIRVTELQLNKHYNPTVRVCVCVYR